MKYLKCDKNIGFSWNIVDENNNFIGISGTEPTGVYLIQSKFEDVVNYVTDKLDYTEEMRIEKNMLEIKTGFSDKSLLTKKIFCLEDKYFVVELSNGTVLVLEGMTDENVCGKSYKAMYGEICDILFEGNKYSI